MKKLSISLFAVLAIVFATTTAFTAKKDKKANSFTTTYSAFALAFHEVVASGNTDDDDVEALILEPRYTDAGTINGANEGTLFTDDDKIPGGVGGVDTQGEFDTWFTNLRVEDAESTEYQPICDDGDETYLCVVYLKHNDAGADDVMAFYVGDFAWEEVL